MLYLDLNPAETKTFQEWARTYYTPGTDEINEVWHPVVKAECMLMDIEAADRKVADALNERYACWNAIVTTFCTEDAHDLLERRPLTND